MSSAFPAPQPPRVLSVDAFRGFVMLLMMDGALSIPRVARQFPDSPVWQTLAFHTDHVVWTGCSLHDLIQPAFSFLVGVSLPYSIANREARGDTFGWMLLHAVIRGLILMALGIFLRSTDSPITNWTFMDTLTQIGMGYVFLFLIGYARSQLLSWLAVVVILIGYWAAFALYPLPSDDFDYAAVGVKSNEPGRFDGSMAHWNKNANLASDFDRWFLNQFPRAKYDKGKIVENPFLYERSGYTTLNFIPTLATMILGLIAGTWLRKEWRSATKVTAFLIAGAAGLALGEASEWLGVCPVVKIIWTPAWVLYSAGWTFLFLAAFYAVIDIIGFWHRAFPLVVIGANSIVAYCAYHWAIRRFISDNYKIHLSRDLFKFLGDEYEPIVQGVFVIATIWLVLFWMYRNRIFVRI